MCLAVIYCSNIAGTLLLLPAGHRAPCRNCVGLGAFNLNLLGFPLSSGPGDGAVVDKRPVRLATAIFPVLSLLNHSCCPNTSVSFSGTAATVRAAQPISSGQEVLHCYGKPQFCVCPKAQTSFTSPYHADGYLYHNSHLILPGSLFSSLDQHFIS